MFTLPPAFYCTKMYEKSKSTTFPYFESLIVPVIQVIKCAEQDNLLNTPIYQTLGAILGWINTEHQHLCFTLNQFTCIDMSGAKWTL